MILLELISTNFMKWKSTVPNAVILTVAHYFTEE